MNDSKPEARRKARRFSEEFKQDAVRLVVSEEYTFKAAAAAVGVSEQTLRQLARQAGPEARRARRRSHAAEIAASDNSANAGKRPLAATSTQVQTR